MKFIQTLSLTLISLLFAPLAFADAMIWQISKDGKTHYLGGTIHVLTKDDYPLPNSFDTAYQASDKLILEIPPKKVVSKEFDNDFMMAMRYPPNESLRNHLKRSTYLKLAAYFQDNDIPMSKINGFRPGIVAIMMTLIELRKVGFTSKGVDHHFAARALDDNKQLGGLETEQEQIQYLVKMGKGKEDQFILKALEDTQENEESIVELREAWKTSNIDALIESGLTPLKTGYPEIYADLIIERNQNWMPKIQAEFANKNTTLILVGALHLVGEDGLLHALEKQGYTLKQMP